MKITRSLNHMTWSQLQEYSVFSPCDIEVNDGVAEEILLEVDKDGSERDVDEYIRRDYF